MQQVDLCDLLEHFAGEMLGGGKARAREHDLARMPLGIGDQFLDVIGWKSGRVTIIRLAVAI